MKLKKFGVAGKDYINAELAKGDTYTCLNGDFPPTNLACDDNPYIDELNSSKYILDLGCGVGRNLPWIMDNTNAFYVGLDPNTTMTDYFWETQTNQGYNIDNWKDRVLVCNSFDNIPSDIKFDYVVSTFVLQHLGYRYSIPGIMNLTDITQNVFKHMNSKSIWFAIEHDSEEDWIPRWVEENGIKLDVYIRSYIGLPELTERDNTAPNGGHHLLIFQHENNI